MKRPEVSYLDFSCASGVGDPELSPQLGSVQLFSVHRRLEGIALGLRRVAEHERPERLRDPKHIDVQTHYASVSFKESHREGLALALYLVDDAPVALICSEQMISEQVAPLAVLLDLPVEVAILEVLPDFPVDDPVFGVPRRVIDIIGPVISSSRARRGSTRATCRV